MATITRAQLFDGIASFAEKEMIPLLPENDQFQAIAALVLVRGSADALATPLFNNPMLKMLGITPDSDAIDVEKVYAAIKKAEKIRKFKPIELNIPLIGASHKFIIKSSDIDKLYEHLTANMVEGEEDET